MTAVSAPSRPHAYQPRRGAPGYCTCGRIRAWRGHQAFLWRLLHPLARWR